MRFAFLRSRRFWKWVTYPALGLGVVVLVLYAIAQQIAVEYEPRSFLVEGEKIAPSTDLVGEELRGRIEVSRLRELVAVLASEEFAGRDNTTPGGELARKFLVKKLQEIGLEPLFAGSYLQDIVVDEETCGTNVAGRLPGRTPDAEAILLVAHYDHLGLEDGELHLGADDNASGVAILLEVARALVSERHQGEHQIVFLFPDAEEPPDVRSDRMGSTYFVDHPPIALDKVRLSIVLDVMGGRPIRRDPDLFFVMGAESSPQLVRLVRSVPQPPRDARYEMMSVAMIEAEPYLPWVQRSKSDYHGFRLKGRPFLFLTSAPTPFYHTPKDKPDTLAYEKMAAESGYLADLAHRASLDTTRIEHFPKAVDPAQDVKVSLKVLDQILAEPGEILEATVEALRQDREHLLEMKEKLDRAETLTPGEYRELTLVGLRIQCALTRPTYRMCTKF